MQDANKKESTANVIKYRAALELEEAADDPAPVNPFTVTSVGGKLPTIINEDPTKE